MAFVVGADENIAMEQELACEWRLRREEDPSDSGTPCGPSPERGSFRAARQKQAQQRYR